MLRRFLSGPGKSALIAIVALQAALVRDQVKTATFYGTATDPSGASVSGATVRLLNESTGVELTKATGEGVDSTFYFLQVGTYQLKIERTGFKLIQSSGIELSAGQNVRRNFP